MNDELSKTIVDEIEKQKVSPKPRWRFLLKNRVLWFLTLTTTAIGGLAVATIIFILTDHDWDVFVYLDRSFLEDLVISLPYLWIGFVLILVAIARYDFKHTKRGYRYSTLSVVALSVAGSVLFGTLLFFAGFDAELHNGLIEQVPLYERLIYTKDDVWIYPEKGLLSGHILSINDGRGLSLEDYAGHTWSVITGEDSTLEDDLHLEPGMRIKLIGRIREPDVFKVDIIRPWGM